jgi:hypothetical protein
LPIVVAGHITVSTDQYLESLGFTFWVFEAEKIGLRDLYKGSKRAFGEFVEHVVRGKIAELAFKNFMKQEHRAELLTEVELPVFLEGDYLPDVVAFRQGDASWIIPTFWVDVKAVQEGHKWMLIRASSLSEAKTKRRTARLYDAYVNVLVKLPPDHLARLLKNVPDIGSRMSREMLNLLADVPHVEADILGYALLSDIEDILKAKNGDRVAEARLNSAFGEHNWAFFAKGGKAYDPETGEGGAEMQTDNCAVALSALRSDWTRFLSLLGSEGLASKMRLPEQRSFKEQMTGALEKYAKTESSSWFARPLPPKSMTISRWLDQEYRSALGS